MKEVNKEDKQKLSKTDELKKSNKDKKQVVIIPTKIHDPSVDAHNPMGEKIK